MRRNFFVTGTDTGVGKTLVTAALLRVFREAGIRVAGMKPIAAGASPDLKGPQTRTRSSCRPNRATAIPTRS